MSRRASMLVTQRLVPSAAALRPSRVVANFQVTNGRPWSTANVHDRVESRGPRPRAGRRSTSTPAARERRGAAGGDRVGVGLGEDDPGDAGRDQRLGARAGAAGVVARLEGHHRGRAAGAGRRPRPARRPRRAGVPAPRWKPSAISVAVGGQQDAADARVRPEGYAGGAARARARAASRARSATVNAMACPFSSARSRTRRGGRKGGGRRTTRVRDADTCVALPIRTLTVGPGVPPGQPAAGCSRVADFHRRLGIAPTPEHASSRTRRDPACHIPGRAAM